MILFFCSFFSFFLSKTNDNGYRNQQSFHPPLHSRTARIVCVRHFLSSALDGYVGPSFMAASQTQNSNTKFLGSRLLHETVNGCHVYGWVGWSVDQQASGGSWQSVLLRSSYDGGYDGLRVRQDLYGWVSSAVCFGKSQISRKGDIGPSWCCICFWFYSILGV